MSAVQAIGVLGGAPRATDPIAAGPVGALTAAGGADFARALAGAGVGAGRAPSPTVVPGLAGRMVLDRALLALGRPAPTGVPGAPVDGAAFVRDAFRRSGVALPDGLAEQATMGVPVASVTDARSGDLVVVGEPPSTVGVYAGRGRILHAPADGGPVRLDVIEGPVTVRRIVENPVSTSLTTATTPGTLAALRSTAAAGAPVRDRGAGAATAAVGAADGDLSSVPFADLFQRAAAARGLDAALLAAVARTESGFDTGAVSRAGAQGLMQFMPATAAAMGVDPWDPASAIDGAARYLRRELDRFGRLDLAVAAYNAGPAAVQGNGGIPPFPETQAYVRKVLDAREQYLR